MTVKLLLSVSLTFSVSTSVLAKNFTENAGIGSIGIGPSLITGATV